MKMLKKISALFLSLAIAVNLCAAVSAAEVTAPEPAATASSNEIVPLWTDVATITTGLTFSNGTANMKLTVRAYDNIQRVEATVRLQRYSGGSWSTIGTYTPSNNRYFLVWEGKQSTNIIQGYNYRLYATIKVYELSGSTYVLQETIDRTYERYY